VIAPQPRFTTGDLAALAQEPGHLFNRVMIRSPELLQEQATSVADLHQKLIEARRQRLKAEEARDAHRSFPGRGSGVLSGGQDGWDVVIVDDRFAAARFTLTSDIGDLRPREHARPPTAD